MYHIIILDNQEKDLEITTAFVAKCFRKNDVIKPYSEVEIFWADECTPDIALIDIELNGNSGIEVAQKLNWEYPLCQIIFLSGDLVYAPDGYTAQHIAVITKNRMLELLPHALRYAKKMLLAQENDTLVLTQKGNVNILRQHEIVYAERIKRNTYLYTSRGTAVTPQSLNVLLPQLRKGHFSRCHESLFVNLEKIERLNRTELWLVTGKTLPVSRSRYPILLKALEEFIAKSQ